jgi:hypothetical protein
VPPGAGLQLVGLAGAGERLLPAAELDQRRDRASPGGGERFAVAAPARLRLHLLGQRKLVRVLLGCLEQIAEVVRRPPPGNVQLRRLGARNRRLEQAPRLDPAPLEQ